MEFRDFFFFLLLLSETRDELRREGWFLRGEIESGWCEEKGGGFN